MTSTDAGPLGAIGQIALHVSDPDRAERFYRDTLGLPLLFRFGDLLFVDCAGVRLMLEGRHESTGRREQLCVCCRVSAIDAVVRGAGQCPPAARAGRGAVMRRHLRPFVRRWPATSRAFRREKSARREAGAPERLSLPMAGPRCASSA